MESKQILSFFAKYIERELGIIYSESNYFQLENRLGEIASFIGARDMQELYDRAQVEISGNFKQLLLDLATNNETSFFRDPKVFRAIESVILRSASQNHSKGETLQIWSAACSTGQEPLSIAMLINEFNSKNGTNIPFTITATDISDKALARAKSATYSQLEVQRGLPALSMAKYFTKNDDDRWVASPDLTRHIEYRKLNLVRPFPFPSQFQLVLCRNVLIYHSLEGKTDILSRITSALAPGGFLVLGSGESLLGISNDYEQCHVDGAIIYRKKDGKGQGEWGLKECFPQTHGF